MSAVWLIGLMLSFPRSTASAERKIELLVNDNALPRFQSQVLSVQTSPQCQLRNVIVQDKLSWQARKMLPVYRENIAPPGSYGGLELQLRYQPKFSNTTVVRRAK